MVYVPVAPCGQQARVAAGCTVDIDPPGVLEACLSVTHWSTPGDVSRLGQIIDSRFFLIIIYTTFFRARYVISTVSV